MANPFDDDEFDELDQVDDALESDVVRTDLLAKDDDDDDDDDDARPSRRERRGRHRDDRRLEDAHRRELEARDRRIAELQQARSSAPPSPPVDDRVQHVNQVTAEIDNLQSLMSATVTEHQQLLNDKADAATVKAAEDRFNKLQEDKHAAITRRELIRLAPAPTPPEDPAVRANRERLRTISEANADVTKSPEAHAFAEGELRKMSKGRPGWKPTDKDFEAAFEKARQELGLGRYANLPASEHQRRATSGYPTGRSPGASSSGKLPQMTDEDRQRAIIWFDAVIGDDTVPDKKKVALYQKQVMTRG